MGLGSWTEKGEASWVLKTPPQIPQKPKVALLGSSTCRKLSGCIMRKGDIFCGWCQNASSVAGGHHGTAVFCHAASDRLGDRPEPPCNKSWGRVCNLSILAVCAELVGPWALPRGWKEQPPPLWKAEAGPSRRHGHL